MRILYFDCFAGASGDMLFGALLDAGAPLDKIRAELAKLPLRRYELRTERVMKRGLSALSLTVDVEEKSQPHRHFQDIENMLLQSGLQERVREMSVRIFRRLAVAEGKIHNKPPAHVHFHEVGAVDSIVDIVGTAAAIHFLGAEKIKASALHTGGGFVRCAHGELPVPAPATLELVKGFPVYSRGIEAELLTPTGAAILTTLAEFGPLPAMTVENTGYGAGKKDLEIANVLRVIVGSTQGAPAASGETVIVLEANIDDMNPEFYSYVMEKLFAAGALDVSLQPSHMKKNRPGVHLTVLVAPPKETGVLDVMFRETTTLGIRRTTAEKLMLPRRHVTVATEFGPARIKLGGTETETLNAAPEYEDCLALAREHNVPIKTVYAAALKAWGLAQSKE